MLARLLVKLRVARNYVLIDPNLVFLVVFGMVPILDGRRGKYQEVWAVEGGKGGSMLCRGSLAGNEMG